MGGSKNIFWRDYKILIIIAAAFTIYTILLAAWVNYRAEVRICEQLGIDREALRAVAVAEPEAEEEAWESQKAPYLLTGADSWNNAVNAYAEPLAKHIAGLRQKRKCTKAGAETYAWVDIAILLSGKYGDDLTDFISDPMKIEGYYDDVFVRDEDSEIARKVAEMVLKQKFPNGFTTDFQYAVINADGTVTARTDLTVTSKTKFWSVEG